MPLQFRMSFSAQVIDQDRFADELRRNLRRLLREAGALFYNTLIALLPVDTGFLAGSLDSIKQATGATGSPNASRGSTQLRRIYTHFGDRRVFKNSTSGRQFMSRADDILIELSSGNSLKMIFQYVNDIRYYAINDLHGTHGRSAWHFTEQAARAAVAFIEANLGNIVPAAVTASVRNELISYRPGSVPKKIKI